MTALQIFSSLTLMQEAVNRAVPVCRRIKSKDITDSVCDEPENHIAACG